MQDEGGRLLENHNNRKSRRRGWLTQCGCVVGPGLGDGRYDGLVVLRTLMDVSRATIRSSAEQADNAVSSVTASVGSSWSLENDPS